MHLRSFSEQMYAFTRATGKLGKPSLASVTGGVRGATGGTRIKRTAKKKRGARIARVSLFCTSYSSAF